MSEPSMLASLRELFSHVSPRRRRQLGPVLLLMLAGAVAEVVSLGAILPFLAVVSKPQIAVTNASLRPFLGAFGLDTQMELVIAAAVAFAFSAVVAAGVRLLLVWASQKFVFGVAQELGVKVYSRTLHQPYSYHTARNSSETLAAINKAQLVTSGLLVPLMQAANAVVIAVFILTGLLFIDPIVAVASGLGFSAIYLSVMRFTRSVMWRNGGIIAHAQKERVQAANEGLGGIRDILLDRSQLIFVRRFAAVERELRRAQATNNFIAAAPRLIVEGLGLVLIAGLALMLSFREGGLLGAIPVLGALALGAQRLLPLLQQIYTGWTAYMTTGQAMRDVLEIMKLPVAPHLAANRSRLPLSFERAIRLENVCFQYPANNHPAIKDVSLNIFKGTRVGFVGKTGSGKSTLMDLVLGLLTPTGGRILIDEAELSDENRSDWQTRIAHVPQAIYLADGSIAENIAFGVPTENIDYARVRRAAEQAELRDVIEALPAGYDSIVGERGVRLSGGQRQRIGIARALYKEADVLVFDEATSALDNRTESAVMEAIEALDQSLTVLIIAHRLSTIASCDHVFDLSRTDLPPSSESLERMEREP